MKNIHSNIRKIMLVMLILFGMLIAYFAYAVTTYGSRWFSNPHNVRLESQKNTVIPGSILDTGRETLAYTNDEGQRVYSKDKTVRSAVAHVVGDPAGQTGSGAESLMAKYILGFDINLIERIGALMAGTLRGSDVVLTIDDKLSKTAWEAMGNYNGAVIILNYQTGEVLASVSKPAFDPNDMESVNKEDPADSTLVNRVTMGRYTPGSVFKLVTATAALRYISDAKTRKWQCDGPMVFDSATYAYLPNIKISPEQDRENVANNKKQASEAKKKTAEIALATPAPEENNLYLRDYQSDYHGEVTLAQAVAYSCNNCFAKIALEVGASRMEKTAEELGFNQNYTFNDFVLYESKYEPSGKQYELAWSAVGQYKDISTPMQMAMLSGAIANGGIMMEPKLLKGVINSGGYVSQGIKPKEFKAIFSQDESQTLTEYMRLCVTKGTGRSSAVKGYEVCGKTGTAEVADNKSIGNHAWYTGFIDSDQKPFAIAVILEHAGSGGGKAAPVAQKVLAKAVSLF